MNTQQLLNHLDWLEQDTEAYNEQAKVGYLVAIKRVREILPTQKEANLEALIEKSYDNLQGLVLKYKDFSEICEYFYNLGLGERSE